MSFDPFRFIERWVALAFVAAWLVLEWQARRLDRLREARERAAEREKSHASTTHTAQETHDSHDTGPPSG